MGAVAAGAIGLGTVIGTFGQIKESEAREHAARQNALLLDEEARLRRAQAEEQARIFEDESEITFGDQVSSFAKAGIDIGSGTPQAVLAESRRKAKSDAAAIRINGARAAALTARQAAQQRDNANAISDALPFQIGSTLLTGAGSAASQLGRR